MPTFPSSSAQAARAAVAARLRELRLEAGLTGVELAQRCGWHKAKSSRIENARTPPSDTDIRAWCAACGAERHTEDLIASSRNAESMFVEWQRKQRTGLRRLQDSYVERYRETTHFRVYSPDIVPGFVQTPAYAAALLSSITDFRRIPDDVSEAVAARTRRSQIIHDGHRRFALIVEEAVLRYRIADAATMAGQLGHLLSIMSLPTVSLGIIPFTAPRPMWPLEACYIFDDRLVQVELLTTDVTLRAPTEIATYLAAFAELHKLAVHGDDARDLITSAIASLKDS
ncbi:helix-turn-helix domain-containing protein [Streptomonospora wellingtoniae]|uniref:Helix-turn-helix transcriptional regulator n=1 Tax=Streptomonospora wellingtoniae TaxID=3075544 RepID=A0ABU2KZ76_9ACTN|nr:helix-turn-helix transcriptional regulator [Streptomonospora sp. DSM 45055]MDT0304328.1 helix-turn-helix transcriptional regulator [Streptomonospora sp. DSM 45055]